MTVSDIPTQGVTAWHELMSEDPDRARTFYREVLGLTTAPLEGAPYPYTVWLRGGQAIGGLVPPQGGTEGWPSGQTPHWVSSFAVADVDEVARKAEEHGGEVLVAPVDIPRFGRAAVLKDAEGAVFGVFRSET